MENTLKNYIQNKSRFLDKYVVVYTLYLNMGSGGGRFAHALVFDTEDEARAFINDFGEASDSDKALSWETSTSTAHGMGYMEGIEGLFIVESTGFLELQV
jgi:hypothetical protein